MVRLKRRFCRFKPSPTPSGRDYRWVLAPRNRVLPLGPLHLREILGAYWGARRGARERAVQALSVVPALRQF